MTHAGLRPEEGTANQSIYKVARRVKQREQNLYNALRSIFEDAEFVQEIRSLWPELPLLANLRCGLWYSSQFDGSCYYKSTDGHNGNWSFNTCRLNFHVATLAAERGGCIVVDATRKGKRFPDSMSKTIPIWACVLNRALADFQPLRPQELQTDLFLESDECSEKCVTGKAADTECIAGHWDSALHLPSWVSHVEKANIERCIDSWVVSLISTGVNLERLAELLTKPLRPLWISQKSLIWLDEVPSLDDWPFTPIILVSASRVSLLSQRISDASFSWNYIPGAADDEESWARGLTPVLFWKHAISILSGGPSNCNGKVADMVERDRTQRALQGHHAPQIRAKSLLRLWSEKAVQPHVLETCNGHQMQSSCQAGHMKRFENAREESTPQFCFRDVEMDKVGEGIKSKITEEHSSQPLSTRDCFHWIGNTGLAVSSAENVNVDLVFEMVDSVINCGVSSFMNLTTEKQKYVYLAIVGSKYDRHSLQSHLPEAVSFARDKLLRSSTVLIISDDGEDVSVSVCLAILLSSFNSKGTFDWTPSAASRVITKVDVRQYLIYLSCFNTDARPSRGNLKQVFNFFNQTDCT